jgi:hypothetical protein
MIELTRRENLQGVSETNGESPARHTQSHLVAATHGA